MYFKHADVDVIAPALIQQTWSEAEVLGSAVWLWMQSQPHQNLPLNTLSALLMPAIKHRQFVIASQAGRPVFYVSWANFSEEAEERYLQQHPIHMPNTDWNSGDRGWFLDWVAPFGHTRSMVRLMEQQLFANRCMRSLYHRGRERGLRIKHFSGKALLQEEVHHWFDTHPITLNPSSIRHDMAQKEFV